MRYLICQIITIIIVKIVVKEEKKSRNILSKSI